MINLKVDQSVKIVLLTGLPITILLPKYIEEDVGKMKNNVVGYVLGSQKEIIELSCECPDNNKERHAVCFKEFKDEFNLCANNNTNHSVILRI